MAIKNILEICTIANFVPKSYLHNAIYRNDFDNFKTTLKAFLNNIKTDESEEHNKNVISDFLKNSFYKNDFLINTKGRIDLAIYNGKDAKSTAGVLIETKSPSNKNEWFKPDDHNVKTLHELILYYLQERIEEKNIDIKYLIATNCTEWYIFETNEFEKHFYEKKSFVKEYEDWRDGKKINTSTNLFYDKIAKPCLNKLETPLQCLYFNLNDYTTNLYSTEKDSDLDIKNLYKIFHPDFLLKTNSTKDSNSLDLNFYRELLHIMGLEEVKQGGKPIIQRKENDKCEASFFEQVFTKIATEGLGNINNINDFGNTNEEQHFNIALELCITWINRILFLKLLEAQIVGYHNGNKDFQFLKIEVLPDFKEVYKLFHLVLAVPFADRNESLKNKYERVPYLNSSLFEITELEKMLMKIESLDNSLTLDFIPTTILKNEKNKAKKLTTLTYLFAFLDAYNFSADSKDGILEGENKSLINASVLGKVFEKINGYKDGSIFTPSFITMYMSRESIRLAVIDKFKEAYKWEMESIGDLHNYLSDKRDAKSIKHFNNLINSILICDPAVGSGHFLVSALNEIIAIKSELGILANEDGIILNDIKIIVADDELKIVEVKQNYEIPFEYIFIEGNRISEHKNKIQQTLFHEKQTLIENCLFGVDINPKSVLICRLRLWIELLKNAYYTKASNYKHLETLPNIDINIKTGNSLLSKINLDEKKFNFGNSKNQKLRQIINDYKKQVQLYKHVTEKNSKKKIEEKINEYKKRLKEFYNPNDKEYIEIQNIKNELNQLSSKFFEVNFEKKSKALSDKLNELENKYNEKYRRSFEWRFEFPETLNEDGNFLGFDLIIGNPPYISNKEILLHQKQIYKQYILGVEQFDLYSLFVELSYNLLKDKGYNSLIIPDSMLARSNFKSLREFLHNNTYLFYILHINNVFENAAVSSCVYCYKKSTINKKYNFNYLKTQSEKAWKNGEIEIKKVSFLTHEPLNSYRILFLSIKEIKLLTKYFSYNPIQDLTYSWRGEEIGKKSKFIQTNSNKSNLKIVFGENINRYCLKGNLQFINKKDIDKDFINYTKEKILIRQLGDKINAVLDIEENISVQSVYNIFSIDKILSNKVLLAILNSRLINFVYKNVYAEKQQFPRILLENIRSLTIPKDKLNGKIEAPFIKLVDKIIAGKKEGIDTSSLEKEIDELVYALYDLTKEEIKIIEGLE